MNEDREIANRYLWGAAVDQVLADEQVEWNDVAEDYDIDRVLWPLADHQGTVRDLAKVNGSGVTEIVNTRTYDAYGNLLAETTPTVHHLFGFTARPTEGETGLQNNLNRWYDPEVGTWLNEDLIGFEGGDANLYRYCGNDPVNAVDPSGLQWDGIINPPGIGSSCPPPADGRCGRQRAMTVQEAVDMISRLKGKKIAVDTKGEGGATSIVILGFEIREQANGESVCVLEIGTHGGPDGIALGPKGKDDRVYGEKVNETNIDKLADEIKKSTKGGKLRIIVLTGCCTGNRASSKVDPSWVQRLADRTGCIVIAPGGYMKGTFLGEGEKLVKDSHRLDRSGIPDLPGNTRCYPSACQTVFVFRPQPVKITVQPLPPGQSLFPDLP